jgi:alkanesulfonate monooxygenase SsuD/methylene tetrahydromethanopterin reductase-like flavin-dependent oxidoreductase (luciferase family)
VQNGRHQRHIEAADQQLAERERGTRRAQLQAPEPDRAAQQDQAEPYAHNRWLVSSDADEHVEQIKTYVDYGFDELVFHFPGEEQEAAVERYGRDILPRLRERFG